MEWKVGIKKNNSDWEEKTGFGHLFTKPEVGVTINFEVDGEVFKVAVWINAWDGFAVVQTF